jgi:putative Holliday junction resolvase
MAFSRAAGQAAHPMQHGRPIEPPAARSVDPAFQNTDVPVRHVEERRNGRSLLGIDALGRASVSSDMILAEPAALAAAVPAGARLLGLDVGTKTIGLALSDTRRIVATPLETIRRRRFAVDMDRLFAIVDAHRAGGLVIGLPLTLAGSDGPRTQSVRQFARNLVGLRDLPVTFWDERLSTAAVTREMIAADLTRKRRAEIVDRVAAAYILQGCLDYLAAVSGLARG